MKRHKKHKRRRNRPSGLSPVAPIEPPVPPAGEPTKAPQRLAVADADRAPLPRFVHGSIMRHILVLTGTGAMGLVSLFVGDLANLLFLGALGDTEVLAAVGYASSVLFFTISVGIGMAIAATSVVSPAIGAGRREEARRLATSALVLSFGLTCLLTLLAWPFLNDLMGWLGAAGRTQSLGTEYLRIIFPAFPLLAFAMSSSAVLRSAGDAQRSMFVTLTGAIVNVILDPIFIFALKQGLHGAAWASVLARVATLGIGLWSVGKVHGLLRWPTVSDVVGDFRAIMGIGVPVVATNLATPVANAFVTKALAGYGDAAMAAWSVGGRVNPVAFGAVFAMTSAIGPIIGQNFGARNFARVRETVIEAAKANIAFTVLGWLALALSPALIIRRFGLAGDAISLVYLLCWWLPPLFVFLGFLFIANAVFNTLRHPHYATAFNWGRATFGTVPFVLLGGHWFGAAGVFSGSMIGGILFGLASLWMSLRLVDNLRRADH